MPTAHGKADLTLYRSEGKKVLQILARLGVTERASIECVKVGSRWWGWQAASSAHISSGGQNAMSWVEVWQAASAAHA